MTTRDQATNTKYRAQQLALQNPVLNNALQSSPDSVEGYITAEITTLPQAITMIAQLTLIVQSILDDDTYFPTV